MADFRAERVAVESLHELNAFAVILAEHADALGWRLELQRALHHDPQDVDAGMDTYCICLATGATHYGGIEACLLTQSRLELRLSPEAAAQLEIDEELVVLLDLPAALHQELNDGLRFIFGEDGPVVESK